MPPRAHALFLCAISLFSLHVGTVNAAEAGDPFDTAGEAERLLPPHRSAAPGACRFPAAGQPLSAADAVDLALCNNPQTQELWANARAQAAQVGASRAAFLPALDGKLSLAYSDSNDEGSHSRSAALTLSWLLFDFGAREAHLENSRQLLAATLATQDATLQNLIFSTLRAYYAAQGARASLAAALVSEQAAQQSFNAADSRYRAGTATPADRLQGQTAWSQATLNRLRATGEVHNSTGILASFMGLDAHHPLLLPALPSGRPTKTEENEEERGKDIDALIESARRHRPDLRAAEAQLRAAQASIEAHRANGMPSLSLGVTPAWQNSNGIASQSATLGVTLNFPLFSGYSTHYKVRNAQALAQGKAAQRDRLRLQIALDVWQAYQSLGTARQTLKTSADLQNSAEQSERVTLGRYKAGVGTLLDVLNAQGALAYARQQGIQAALDWRLQRAALAQALGTLDASHLPSEITGTLLP